MSHKLRAVNKAVCRVAAMKQYYPQFVIFGVVLFGVVSTMNPMVRFRPRVNLPALKKIYGSLPTEVMFRYTREFGQSVLIDGIKMSTDLDVRLTLADSC